jgi:DNA-binding beta-propeller fold protein YncE
MHMLTPRYRRIALAGHALLVAAALVVPAAPVLDSPPAGVQGRGGALVAAPPVATMVGVNVQSMSQLPAVVTLAGTLGQHLAVTGFYADWTTGYPADRVAAVAATGSEPMITWEPWNHSLGGKQTTYPLVSIAKGSFDGYLRTWAAGAKAFRKPILVRLMHEMNAGWYPWGLGVNGNTGAQYVAAFRHVHDVFAQVGASNVRWVWSPQAVTKPSADLPRLYPGGSYVTVVGIDAYNFGVGVPYGRWTSPETLLAPTLAQLPSVAPGKPVLLAETGSSELGGSKAAWITDLLAYLRTQPRVTGFLWSEYSGTANWPLESSPAATAAMRAALPAYLAPR